MNHGIQPLQRTLRRLALVVFVLAAFACGGSARPVPSTPAVAAPTAQGTYQTLAVRVMRRMTDGSQFQAGSIERPISALHEVPITYLVRHLSDGRGDAPDTYEQRLELGNEKFPVPAPSWKCEAPAGCLAKEWLQFELRGTGAPRTIERVLFERFKGEDQPTAGYRRYTIAIVSGSVSRAQVRERVQREGALLRIDERKAQAEVLEHQTPDPAEALKGLDALDPGSTLGHLIALAFAAESDVLTERLAATVGVKVRRDTPRILITTVESQGDNSRATLSLDLRLDEVAVESAEAGRARMFQLSRGIEQSALEARVFDHIAGKGAGVSTAGLMLEARRRNIDSVVISSANRADIQKLRAPQRFAALLAAAVDRGQEAIVPKSAVPLAGKNRWGFWQVDPVTGATVGVMEGGQYQGMVDVTQTTRKVALDPRKAFLLGLNAGMIQSQFGLIALIFKHGEVTPALIQELKDMLKDSACKACPELSAGVEVSIKVGEDCFKVDLVKKDKAFEFCERYGEGFRCALGMLIASLQGENQLPVKLEAEAKIKVGCTEVKVGSGE
jgi:hypothetical protein